MRTLDGSSSSFESSSASPTSGITRRWRPRCSNGCGAKASPVQRCFAALPVSVRTAFGRGSLWLIPARQRSCRKMTRLAITAVAVKAASVIAPCDIPSRDHVTAVATARPSCVRPRMMRRAERIWTLIPV